MEHYLNRINIVLIALVGGLCVWQWSGEKKADVQIESLRRAVDADERHAAAQDQAIRGANEDIDEFKKLIASLKAKSDAGDVEIRQDKARIFTLEQEEKRRAADADLSARALAAYKQGIAVRDGNIHLLLDQRQQLATANYNAVGQANQAVTAYNGVASKYAALVGQYNELANRYKALTNPPPADKKTTPAS
jgi:hypothetical protein